MMERFSDIPGTGDDRGFGIGDMGSSGIGGDMYGMNRYGTSYIGTYNPGYRGVDSDYNIGFLGDYSGERGYGRSSGLPLNIHCNILSCISMSFYLRVCKKIKK